MKNYINNFLFAIVIVLFSSFGATAQTVTSVVASLDGAEVTITYDYADAGYNIPRYINLYMSTDGGTTYSPLSGISGDVGGPITDGMAKTIVWNILSDYPAGLTGVTSTFEVRGFPFEVVPIAGGTFEMGCKFGRDNINGESCFSDESPLHNVTLSDFAIGKYEITNAQYVTFLNAEGVDSNGTFIDVDYGYSEYIDMDDPNVMIVHNGTLFLVRDNSANGTDLSNYPVADVTWRGANAYARWVGGRLPTEAEWEYAARGGSASQGYQLSGSNTIGDVSWYQPNSNSLGKSLHSNVYSHPIGTKSANELGLHDMSGNVSEWCQDTYGSTYYSSSPLTNPQGPGYSAYRLIRGGSWSNSHNYNRVSDRSFQHITTSTSSTGFRVVAL